MAVLDEYKWAPGRGSDDDIPPASESLVHQEGANEGEEGTVASGSTNISSATAAALAGGVIGLLVGGPVLGLVAGIGTGYAATTEGPSGDIARATGDVAVSVGKSAKQINDKHHVTDKAQESIQSAWVKVREVNEKHHLVARISACLRSMGEKVMEYENKSHILENILKGIVSGATALLEKLRGRDANEQNVPN
mmetsp:Transcript_26320/g.37719  ORF Transcript_26320/g.37719 Transcript_26320/m.37719 type:complete len:194 (-) Transcript_26320:872-1453(-)